MQEASLLCEKLPAQGAAHGDDQYQSFMDEIRRSHVDEQEDVQLYWARSVELLKGKSSGAVWVGKTPF